MKLIVCVDDDFGMMFNDRRQSQDSVLRKRILDVVSDGKLWMNSYSEKQFKDEVTSAITVDEDFLSNAGDGDYCFAETQDVSAFESKAESIILYKWNRRYPSDLQFSIDLTSWKLQSAFDFEGSSHEKITEEVYVK